MRKFSKALIGLIAAAVVVVSSYMSILAAGTVSISGDKDSAAVGDTYTVTVNVSDADGASQAPEVSVNYDPNRLSFVECSGNYGGGGGGLITLSDSEAVISFTIISGGQADVNVTGVFEGDGANPQTATATVMVEGEDTALLNESTVGVDTLGIESGSVATADGKYVQSVFANEIMPAGFFKTSVSYEEQMVEAAQFSLGNIVLLYVTDADGNNGNFDIYDQNTGALSDFLQISGIENRFIIALNAPEGTTPPQGFEKAVLQWNAQNLEAYSYTKELPADSTVSANDFFLLYAISSEGNTGWYIYDQTEGTYQRYISGLYSVETPTESSSSEEGILSQLSSVTEPVTEDGSINIVLIIAVAMGVLLLALLITVIVLSIKLRDYRDYELYGDDEDDEEEEDIAVNHKKKSAKNAADDNFLERLAANNEESAEKQQVYSNKNNIYEQYRREDEMSSKQLKDKKDEPSEEKEDDLIVEDISVDVKAGQEEKADNIPEEFVVRKRNASRDELMEENRRADMYERDEDESYAQSVDEDEDLFSPRDRSARLSRADKKAMKQQEKARKKAEKKMRKEFGEFGPVNWQEWQDAVEGGEKTAPTARAGVDSRAVRRSEEELREQSAEMPVSRREAAVERSVAIEREESRIVPDREEPVRKAPKREEIYREEPVRKAPKREEIYREEPVKEDVYNEQSALKGNPMEMMKNIPANDNKAPVQARPVQQFDFDDDFEFEFLSLDDDD